MGYWGIRSYEGDLPHDALDAGFEQVHGQVYEDLMDDGNPLTYDQVQERLADERTLTASIAVLVEDLGPPESWEEDEARLALAGIVVRYAELGVPIPPEWLSRAILWLETESIEWDEATKRDLRRKKEIALLRSASGPDRSSATP